jgi:hypothetical protein
MHRLAQTDKRIGHVLRNETDMLCTVEVAEDAMPLRAIERLATAKK